MVALLFVLPAFGGRVYGNDAGAGRIIVCFRCDDIFALKGHPDGRLYETKKKIIEIFRDNGIPLTLGVIPAVHMSVSGHPPAYRKLTPDDPVASLLKGVAHDRGFEIALHGLTHRPNSISRVSEWIGLPREEQISRIGTAKKILQEALGGVRVKTFVPPWNSFDLNTLEAVKANGLEYLSGDTGIVRNRPFAIRSSEEREYFKVNMVPATCSLAEFRHAAGLALGDRPRSMLVVVFHPYDFPEYGKARGTAAFDLPGLNGLLREIRSDARMEFARIGDVAPDMAPASRYTAACRYRIMLKAAMTVVPRTLLDDAGFTDRGTGRWLDKGRYLGEREYEYLFYRSLSVLILLCALACIPVGLLAALLVSKITAPGRPAPRFAGSRAVIFTTGLLLLELHAEILSSPNMCGLLLVYCTSCATLFLSYSVFMRIKGTRNNTGGLPLPR